MGKHNAVAKKRLDKYYHLAKERGYRSRAAFKLVQLNKKFDFLSGARGVLDLCAAPGSWLQVAREYMPVSGVLVGVDLVPIKAVPRAITLTADITSDKCRAALKKQFKDVRVDVVMHDGAPNVGQNWIKDAFGQSELVLASLKLGAEFLAPGGTFVTKVFRSADYNALLWVFNQLFDKVEATKPAASRSESAEIFVVCSRFTSAKIDPRLFDPKCVFSDLTELKAANALQVKTGYKAPALGYEKDDYTLFHTSPIVDFVRSEVPIRVLSEKSALIWNDADPVCIFYNAQLGTTESVKILCRDLKVLGKGDLRTLLKWRLKMRAKWRERLEAEHAAAGGAPAAEAEEADEDAVALEELEQLAAIASARDKSAVRKAKLRLSKQKERLALKMELPGDRLDLQEDLELFSLARIRSAGALKAVLGDDETGVTADVVLEEEEEERELLRKAEAREHAQQALDDAEYALRLDEDLDAMYEIYKAKSLSKSAQQRGTATRFKRDAADEKRMAARARADDDDDDDEDGAGDEEGGGNPLLRDGSGAGRRAAGEDGGAAEGQELDSWFDQPVFQGLGAKRGIAAVDGAARGKRGGSGGGGEYQSDSESDSDTDTDSDSDEEEAEDEDGPEARSGRGKQTADAKRARTQREERAAAAVKPAASQQRETPAALPSGDGKAARHAAAAARALSSGVALIEESDSEDEGDEEMKFVHGGNMHAARQAKLMREAERIALGQLIIRKRKRQDVEDLAYNRHTFADKSLPEWFMDDERRVKRTGIALVDAEALTAAADALRTIDARSVGKVVEAKARKKRRMVKLIEKLKKTANSIVGKDDMSEREKSQAIEKLYSKKLKTKRPSAKIVVTGRGGKSNVAKAKSGGKGAGGGMIKRVDKRMLKDKRGEKRAATKKGGGKGKGGKGGGKKGGGSKGKGRR